MQMTVEHEMERNIDFQRRPHSGKPVYEKHGIVTNITLVRDSITKKNTLNRLGSKFMSFMRREMHKTNTTKCTKIII